MSETTRTSMTSTGDRELMLLGVKANGAVKSRVLVMTLEQSYRNVTDKNTEITYTFPLPFGAVLLEVEVTLNGKTLKGEVTEKKFARELYEEALSEGNSSIMLEKNHDGSFTLELGNLLAHEDCKIQIRYAQILATEHGQVRLMLPTTIAPRYGNPVTQGKLLPHQVPVSDLTAEYPFDITLVLMGDMAYSNVGSPSHKTSYTRVKDDLVISLSQRGYLDRDFVLVISNLKNDSDGVIALDSKCEGQSAAMAFFSPRIEAKNSPKLQAKVLVDCSASMAGDSIDAARRALMEIVNGFTANDKFSLSRFGDTVEHRSRGLWSGTPQARASAKRWINSLDADLGGTEMATALTSTIAIPSKENCDILLITDGEISGIDEVIDLAKKSQQRVFVVAIGASPSEVHLRRLANATQGFCDFVAPGENVEPAVLRMSSRMRAARATNLRVEWPSSAAISWAQPIPVHAFESDMLTACAFIETQPATDGIETAKLWGCVDGQGSEVLLAEAPLAQTTSSLNIAARLTAFEQYLAMRSALALNEKASDGRTPVEIAVAYQLVTEETNFVLVHERTEEEKAQEMPEAHKVPQMLAAGWGGSGSVVLSQLSRNGKSTKGFQYVASAITGYDTLATPSVWRTNRSQAAARVDALSSGGMDDFEIPAFLRKQSDSYSAEILPPSAGTTRRDIDKKNPLLWAPRAQTQGSRATKQDPGFFGLTPAGLGLWLMLNHTSLWPKTYAELRDLGLCNPICEWLEIEIGASREESEVVAAFLLVITSLGLADPVSIKQGLLTSLSVMHPSDVATEFSPASERIRNVLAGIARDTWPKYVVDFPGCVTD